MRRVLVASSNPGKLRDFTAAASQYGIEIAPVPEFASLPQVEETGETFEANARLKAEHYSLAMAHELVLADDSGLEVDVLNGAPGVRSARFAADDAPSGVPSDAQNNTRLLRELSAVPDDRRTARFVCVIAAARDGTLLATFSGESQGMILRAPRGSSGFGYDPLFFVPDIGKTFAELAPEEKAAISHRGRAFRNFLQWYNRMFSD
jgi:XTP/dITP diphosphohydrolase